MSGDQLPSQLKAAEGIPIAQLSPDMRDPKSRVIHGVVTITWPYSIIKKTMAFLLAEHDFRLRRAKGQVRVEFSGSSAKAVQDAGLGSGDEVTLSLDGVELVTDDSKTRVPGTSLEWQLKFTERLLLQAKISDSEKLKLIDIDHPAIPEPEPEPEQPPDSVLDSLKEIAKSPESVATPARNPPAKRPADQNLGLDEYASPAFLKRARVSYGSLFEGSQDIFDEDIGAKARAKKRVKTGRYSGIWRYASKSPSPKPEAREDDETDDTSMVDEQPATLTPSRPKMVDGACQTVEQDTSPPGDVQVAAEARHDPSHFWQTPTKSTGVQSNLPGGAHTPNIEMNPDLNDGFGQPASGPIFTPAHDHYPPAFVQPPPGPVFGHNVHQDGVEPEYHADGSFHEHSDAYPESGLDHGIDAHGQYPTSFLETPHFDPSMVVTSQPITESMPAYDEHHPSQEGHGMDVEHHTTFIDGVAEPGQVPWGLTSVQHSRSLERPGEAAASHFDTDLPDKTEGVSTDKPGDGQAVPSENWAEDRERQTREHHEDRDGKEAALGVEEDQLSADHDGPEEDLKARTYAERHFEPAEDKDKAAAAVSEDSQDSSQSSQSSESSSEDSDEEAEHEEDDAGGDYDITNYRNLSNNQDDDDASDLESDYGQEDEEEVFDPDVQGNEDGVDEDAENYGEEYDGYEEEEDYDENEDEDEENQPPPAATQSAPQVISLLSDSEDDEDDEDEAPPLQVPQYSGSADELDEDDPEDGEQSDEENVRSQESPQGSSPVMSEEESEEDAESDVGTPTPKPRETTCIPRSSHSIDTPPPKDTAVHSVDMTTTTIGDELETMSPIQIPRATEFPQEGSPRPVSRDDSEMLEAELEQELEQEIAANDVQGDRKSPHEPDFKPRETHQVRTEEEQGPVAGEQAMDTAQPNAKVEEHFRTPEVRIAPQETDVAEAGPEPTDGGVPECMDINMADADDKPANEAAGEQHEESDMDVEEAAEPLLKEELDEEQLIQNQLEDEAMVEPEEPTIAMEISETVEQQEVSTNGYEAIITQNPVSTTSQQTVMETLQVAIKSSITESVITIQPEVDLIAREPEDAMDVHSPDTKPGVASPPATQTQHQSFEEARLIETRVSQASQEQETDDDVRLVQLPTPGETQVTDSFVSQSFNETLTETQITEERNTEVPALELTNGGRPEKESPAVSLERLENPVEPISPINDDSSQIRESSAQPSEAQSSLIAEEVPEEANAAQPTPRRGRGHRRNKSDNKDQDPSVKLARASIASRRSTRLSDRTTPDSARVTRGRSHSLVLKSDSPDVDGDTDVQLARAAIRSPSRATREIKEAKEAKEAAAADQAPGSLKVQIAKSLQADVPDCISLKSLRNHPGKTIDVLAIATTEPPEAKRAKGGPRGIMLGFNVTDHSVAPTQTVPVQIFRPHKAALPLVHPGDAVLLRHFSIASMTGRGFGLRANDGSSWAVFERDAEDGLPQIRGPPVELTEGETSYAALLKQWYVGLDDKALAKLEKANEAAPAIEAGKEDSK